MIFTTKSKITGKKSFPTEVVRKILVALFWLMVWQILYLAVKQEILVVSPVRVFFRLTELMRETEFWWSAGYSMVRIVSGFLTAVLAGTILAVLTSVSSLANDLFRPVISIVKSTPVASFILLALVWIASPYVPAFTSFLMVLPVIWANVTNGIAKTDRNLLQLAQVYHFGVFKTVRRIYIPSIMPYFTAACTTGMGLAWKAGVAAEVLANTKYSIGGHIYSAKIYIETVDLFAWTVVVILLSVLLEWIMTHAMRTVSRKYSLS